MDDRCIVLRKLTSVRHAVLPPVVQDNIKACIEHVARVQNVRFALVENALRTLYQTLSKHVHESQEVPTVNLQTYSQQDAVAIVCILHAANVRFEVANAGGEVVTASYRCPA